MTESRTCPKCEMPFLLEYKRKKPKFCSVDCRKKSLLERLKQERLEARTPKVCIGCGETFMAARPTLQKACSKKSCKNRRWDKCSVCGVDFFRYRNRPNVKPVCKACKRPPRQQKVVDWVVCTCCGFEFLSSNANRKKACDPCRKKNRRTIPTATRRKVIERDGCVCRHCGKEVHEGDALCDNRLHIDHIIPRSMGGSNSHANLQVLCRSCNLNKSNSFIG